MESRKHFYWLDWLRFIAAFMVVVCHARGYNWVEWGSLLRMDQTPLIKLFFAGTRAGLEWVIVFFVLSGFLVGGGVISRCLTGDFDLRLFVIDRVSRIWIPLVPALLLSLGVALFCGLPASLSDMIGNALGLQGIFFKSFAQNEPLWSLSYEIWFYVLIGAVGTILSSESRSRVVAIAVLALGFMAFTRLSPNFLNCWLLGAFGYFLVSERKRPGLLALALAIACFGAAISQVQSDTLSVPRNTVINFLPDRNIAALIESAGMALFIALICGLQPTGQLMVSIDKLGAKLAAFSYTLYLTHYPVLKLWEHFVPERSSSFTFISLTIFLAKISSCLFVGWMLYLPFEAKTPAVRAWMRDRFMH